MNLRSIHLTSIRMRNNAGIDLPVCQRNHRLLNLDSSRWKQTMDREKVTCKNCIRTAANNRFA